MKKKKINIDRIKLTPYERRLEAEIERGEWVPVSKEREEEIRKALEARKKNAVLNIRINKLDLECIKRKAKKWALNIKPSFLNFCTGSLLKR